MTERSFERLLKKMEQFVGLLKHAFGSYFKNIRLISFFSVPFLIAFPVSLLLPNFVAMGSIYLRIGSVISGDLKPTEIALILGLALVSMLLFSFALVAINMLIRSQRTLMKMTFYEFERIEHYTYQLFYLYLLAFAPVFLVNLYLYQYGLHPTVGALVAAIAALGVLFAPPAVVINALLILPFLEVLKVQIYLSKYTIL